MKTVQLMLLAVAGGFVGGFVEANSALKAVPQLPSCIKLEHPKGGCVEIAPHGAHLLSWKIPEHSEVIYLSPQAKFGKNDAIRGGIPICFPQYGQRGPLPFGFASMSNDWGLGEKEDDANKVGANNKVEFVLRDTEATRSSAWPHPFELRYEISFDAEGELLTKMKVRNVGKKDFDFTCALHSYFRVGDTKETTIEGLQGVEYEDALDTADPVKTEKNKFVSFEDKVDRIYGPTPLVLRIVDGNKGRSITIAKDFPDVVIEWNPWDEKAKAMGDVSDADFNKFVCVEVGAIRKAVTVKAGEEWSASQKLSVGGS